MIHISASLLSDFLWCNKRLYYRKLIPEEAVQTREQALGEAVHQFIATEKENNNSLYESYFIKYSVDEEGIAKFKRCVNNYFYSYSSLTTNQDIVEKYFKIPYDKDVYLVGKMDRIIPQNHIIFDWKTEEKVKTSIDNNIQFIIYYLAYKELYGVEPELFYANLAKNKTVKFIPKKEYINPVQNEIIPAAIDTIKRGNFYRAGLYNNGCPYCSFIKDCWKEL